MCTFCFVLCFISLGLHSREQTAVFSQVQKRSPGNSWKLGPETDGAGWTDNHRSNRLRLSYESTQLLQMDDILTEPRTQGWICLLWIIFSGKLIYFCRVCIYWAMQEIIYLAVMAAGRKTQSQLEKAAQTRVSVSLRSLNHWWLKLPLASRAQPQC